MLNRTTSLLTSLSDREWKNVQITYEKELAALRSLRQNLSKTLANLQSETEKLHIEEKAIREQEAVLRDNYRLMDKQQTHYRAKGESSALWFISLH